MAEQNPTDHPESVPAAEQRSVSRRRLVQAGAVALPVLMTMRVPALHGQAPGSTTASCQPIGSYDPTSTVPQCDGLDDQGNPVDGAGTGQQVEGMSTFSEWDSAKQ